AQDDRYAVDLDVGHVVHDAGPGRATVGDRHVGVHGAQHHRPAPEAGLVHPSISRDREDSRVRIEAGLSDRRVSVGTVGRGGFTAGGWVFGYIGGGEEL